MAVTVNIHQAKTHLSRLLEQVAAGEEVVIARAGTPVARLVPVIPTDTSPRQPGALRGRIALAQDWDSAETNEAIADAFGGSG